MDSKTFSARVLEAASSAPKWGRFGDRKVFIFSIWQILKEEPGFEDWDYDADFKPALVKAMRAGDLVLARADFPEGAHPIAIEMSEVKIPGTTAVVHFVDTWKHNPARRAPMATGKIWNVVRINRDPKDTYAADMLGEAIELANPDDGDIVEFGTVRADDAGAARLMKPSAPWRQLEKRGDDWWTKNPAKAVKGNPSFAVRREFDKLFKNSSADAREELFAAMSYAEQEKSGREAFEVLSGANEMLGWRGVATLHPAAKGYKEHTVGYYVDNGDTSRVTLMYDLDAQQFVIGTPDELEGKWYRESGHYESPIAYRLELNKSDWKAVEMMRGRYQVATILSKHDNDGTAEFTESEAHELAEAYEEEGAPNFSPKLEDKIANFIEEIV